MAVLVVVEARGVRSAYALFMIVQCFCSLATLGVITSCGGGSSGSGEGPPPNQTVITATAAGSSTNATHTVDITITDNQ